MDKQDMIKRFQKETGSLFITRTELATVMGYKDDHSVDWAIAGLERVEKGKRYYIPDVIMRIKEGCEFR